MTASLLTIGDELLIGQVVNTNAAWIGEHLGEFGIALRRVVCVSDDEDEIRNALLSLLRDTDVVLCTGGLGPTPDDLTRTAVAETLGRKIIRDPALLKELERRFNSTGRRIPETSRAMADVPEGFEVMPNPIGAAPGLWFEGAVPDVDKSRIIVMLPGVPDEMHVLMERVVLPRLVERRGIESVARKTLLTAGTGESRIAEMLQDVLPDIPGKVSLAYLPHHGTVRLRLTAYAESSDEANDLLGDFEARVRDRLGDIVFGENGDTLEAVVGRLLCEKQCYVGLAESCTGGRLADTLTNVPGASTCFGGGIVAYSNSIKIRILGVDEEILEEEGAVSEAVAIQMAEGARNVLHTDIGLGITGIAGPSGGTPEKPVGTVWIGYADDSGSSARRYLFSGERRQIKKHSVVAALDMLRRNLLRMR